jgi:hypothetical protein
MSYGNLSVILMVILVAIFGVGASFIAAYYLNKAVRQNDVEIGATSPETTSKGD